MSIIHYILDEQIRLAEEKKQLVLQQRKDSIEHLVAANTLQKVKEELVSIGVLFEKDDFYFKNSKEIRRGRAWVEKCEKEDDAIWDNNLDQESFLADLLAIWGRIRYKRLAGD